ncbi:hypothetical protein [Mariniluteicoccus flavus]
MSTILNSGPQRRTPSGLTVLGVMVATRFLTAVLWRLREWEMGDTPYYFTKVGELAAKGLPHTLLEYPIPVAWLLQVPTWAGTTVMAYLGGFVMLMMAFDLAFCALLWARGGRHRAAAVIVWSVFLTALGPLMWLRFDLVPAVAVGAAAIFATTRPSLAGALLAVGAAVKLWPGTLLAFLLQRRTRLPAVGGFIATGGAILIACLALGGRERLLSPLDWQGGRGLQVESVWATPLMLARAGDQQTWSIAFSRWQAFEVFGPGVPFWLAMATVSTVLGMLACLALTWRVVTAPRPDGPAIAAAMLAAVAIIIVTNKTLSPQYIGWLGAPVAALIARVGVRGPARHSVSPATARWWAAEIILVAALSQLIFPFFYDSLIFPSAPEDTNRWVAAGLLTARNVLLVWLTVDTFRGAWVALGARPAQTRVQQSAASAASAPEPPAAPADPDDSGRRSASSR